MLRFFIILLVLSLEIPFVCFGQSERDALENQRKSIQKKIDETNQILQKNRENKRFYLNKLFETSAQIRQREQLIQIVSREIELLNLEIQENELIVSSLNSDLESLKDEYARMVKMLYTTGSEINVLSLLFASNSFTELISRINYIRKYKELRAEQIYQIDMLTKSLKKKLTNLENQKTEKQSLIQVKNGEKDQLNTLKDNHRSLISEIKSKESMIVRDLKREQKIMKDIQKLISANIQSAEFSASLSAEERMLSSAFAKAKGKIAWPVSKGFISTQFGQQIYPGGTGVHTLKIDRLGIDIRTEANEEVRSIFGGKVVDVSELGGRGMMVIIQHGDYFSVYTRIEKVVVKVGQRVQAGTNIGKVQTLDHGGGELEFQIWRHQMKLDPELWIKP